MPTKKIIEEQSNKCESYCCKKNNYGGTSGSAVYGIGLFGAAFYFLPQAVGVAGFFMAIVKSLVWPALLVYQALKLLNL